MARHLRSHQRQRGSGIPVTQPELEIEPEDDFVTEKYTWRNKNVIRNHSPLLPRDIRAIIIGKSGVGKTTLLTHLLLEPELLDYDTLMVCGRSLKQREYEVMRCGFDKNLSKKQIACLFEQQERVGDVEDFLEQYDGDCYGGIEATFYDDVDAIPDPSEWDPEKKNLIVFDDIMLGPQSTPEKYYTRGRHSGVDSIYIAQSYFPLPAVPFAKIRTFSSSSNRTTKIFLTSIRIIAPSMELHSIYSEIFVTLSGQKTSTTL